ncbi:MAG TPA: polyphosphate kinase 2 family protein [Xanthobacteraceae bacterium]|jgi:PPK2 family polyphosphate:nucleotide phosphotransferase|nr:polyphosphate kinase 2 family protein [Xanthobacteraceae bacterium]
MKAAQLKQIRDLVKKCRVDHPRHFKLADHDPAETFGLSTDIKDVEPILAEGVAKLEDMQQRLYANGRWGVLIVLQGMDAAGKDGIVKHVMSGINPQGCEVHSFKAPSAEELEHDFLWRTGKDVPARGRIGIFNRSHYEEVLVVRVHPEMLDKQNLPPSAAGKSIWKHRFKEIRAFERHLTRNGTVVLKFHLRISKEEQRQRFLARLEEPFKRWKFSPSDAAERAHWDAYMAAYQDMIRETSTDYAPWYVVPADHKHVGWLVVSAAIIEAIEKLKLEYPKVEGEALKALKEAERRLKAEKTG